jgi:hypothetical protein
MSLYSGAVRSVNGKYVLDDAALQDSIAKAMDDAMVDAYQKLKGSPLPDKGKDDRRMLFVAIARGLLTYLQSHENDMIATMRLTPSGGAAVNNTVNSVAMNIVTDPPA